MPEEKLTVEELKKRAEEPGHVAIGIHDFYKGNIQSIGSWMGRIKERSEIRKKIMNDVF